MPKNEIDYSNTIIYKITCKDAVVTDVYVGHTTNFVHRKHSHKQNCINEKTANHECKLYEVIRNNGGWSNWKMEIIKFFNCQDHYEARKKEQEYFISLNATLNSIEPMPKPKEIIIKNIIVKEQFYCDTCNMHCDNLKLWEKHAHTNKHKKLLIKKLQISNNQQYCESCDYITDRKSSFDKHLLTAKHQKKTLLTTVQKKLTTELNIFICSVCQKNYKSKVGLWYHAKKCKITEPVEEIIENENNIVDLLINENKDFKNVILDLIKSNTDLHKKMLEVCQTSNITNNMNNTSNSHNKTFNLNFFLNEQCKDAMNIMDFVDTFKLDFTDLDNVGKLGYVEGISNIIIQKLNEMDIYKRPIHCSDLKRETTHVKDKGVWEKDNGNHDKLRLAIRHIAKKNSDMLNPWIEAHPHAQASAHYLNNVYMNYIMQAMGGRGDIDDNETKIIKKIAKVILIDK